MEKLLYVGIGGFIGAAVRYSISVLSAKLFGTHLPYGTLIANVLGGLLIGLVMEMSLTARFITPNLRLFLTTGILGGLTTFSTFSYETIAIFGSGRQWLAIANACLNLFLSLAGVVAGKMAARLL